MIAVSIAPEVPRPTREILSAMNSSGLKSLQTAARINRSNSSVNLIVDFHCFHSGKNPNTISQKALNKRFLFQTVRRHYQIGFDSHSLLQQHSNLAVHLEHFASPQRYHLSSDTEECTIVCEGRKGRQLGLDAPQCFSNMRGHAEGRSHL